MSIAKYPTRTIARKIKSNNKKNTQKSIAKWLGISEPYLSLILAEKRSIPKRLVSKFEQLAHNGIFTISKN